MKWGSIYMDSQAVLWDILYALPRPIFPNDETDPARLLQSPFAPLAKVGL